MSEEAVYRNWNFCSLNFLNFSSWECWHSWLGTVDPWRDQPDFRKLSPWPDFSSGSCLLETWKVQQPPWWYFQLSSSFCSSWIPIDSSIFEDGRGWDLKALLSVALQFPLPPTGWTLGMGNKDGRVFLERVLSAEWMFLAQVFRVPQDAYMLRYCRVMLLSWYYISVLWASSSSNFA